MSSCSIEPSSLIFTFFRYFNILNRSILFVKIDSVTSLKMTTVCFKMLLMIGEAMGLAQHHDAITGTEKQEVAYDYAMRLSAGIDAALVSSNFHIHLNQTISFITVSRMSSIVPMRNFYPSKINHHQKHHNFSVS